MISGTSRNRTIYLVATGLALLALAFGAWDVWVERDGGENLLEQIVLPAMLVALMLGLYLRSRSSSLQ